VLVAKRVRPGNRAPRARLQATAAFCLLDAMRGLVAGRLGAARLLWLAVLPALLVVAVYFPMLLVDGTLPDVRGDGRGHVYQLARAGELGGRWWLLGRDEPVGRPYPSGWEKIAGLYEGLDLMIPSAVTSRLFDSPVTNYFFLMAALLCVNAWIAGALTVSLTGSTLWASVAMVLITLGQPTAARMNGHLHLFKLGWPLLALWAFSRYLDAPSVRRGVWLGLAGVLVLQSSFYFAFFMTLAIGAWWLGALVAGRVGRAHVVPAMVAAAVASVLAVPIVWPVATRVPRSVMSALWLRHGLGETWTYGAQLWQYLLSPLWRAAAPFASAPLPAAWEGWNFPGLAALAATLVYLGFVLRRVRLGTRDDALVHRMFGVVGLLVLLSLAGGPSALLWHVAPAFRAYGRTGVIAFGMWAVLAAVVAHAGLRRIPSRPLRAVLAAAVLAVVARDAYEGQRTFVRRPQRPPPAWVDWLRREPPETRAAVFPRLAGQNIQAAWEWDHLFHWLTHRHETLTGGDVWYLARDLAQLGSTYDRLDEPTLRYVVSLAYDTIVVDEAVWRANPDLDRVPWLRRLPDAGSWRIYRTGADAPRFRTRDVATLLAESGAPSALAAVPAGAWITDTLPVPEPTVVTNRARVRLQWVTADGRAVREPELGLIQHYFAASLPAYTIRTPARPGAFRLRFLDDDGGVLAERAYEVRDRIARLARRPRLLASPDALRLRAGEPGELIVENRTPCYVQAHTDRAATLEEYDRLLPWMGEPAAGAVLLTVRPRGSDGHERRLLLPHDLPPHGTVRIRLPDAAVDSRLPAVDLAWVAVGGARGEAVAVGIAARDVGARPRLPVDAVAAVE
jgi:hypothetical protein